MDLYSNAQNWTQNLTGGTPSTDDWKEQSSPTNGAGGPPGTAAQQPSLDLSDYTIGDLAGPSTSSSISQPPAYYGGPFNPFYLSSVPGPYNAVPYGSMSWTNPQTHLPLSNYSTLNGATSTTSSQQSASQHQSPPAPNQQPMMIDPALTTMNGSGSEPPRQYTQSPTHVAQPTPQSQPRHPYQYQHPTLSINPAYVLPAHFYSSHLTQHQPTSQSQGTLSPHVLHSPTSTMIGQLSSFYTQSPSTPSTSTATTATSTAAAPAQPPTINIQARKDSFVTDVRPLLQPSAFGGARAINNLVNLIDDFGSEEVEPALRMEILTKIRDNAANHYFRAWSENNTAMDITREWLKAAATAKSDTPLVDTVMPLLHIIDRLPLTVESLKSSKLGKIIVKLVKEPPAPAIKDMASNLERRWRQLVETAQKQAENTQTEDSKLKKRKPVEQPSAKPPPPAKKAAVAPTASASKPTAMKKETKPVLAVKDARSDSSFFSAPKPKAKLPSFKKAPAPVKKEPDLNVAQPSSIDPFQEALKSMGKGRRDSPVTATPPPASMSITPPLVTSGRTKRKSVTWAPDGQLESIRLIERAVYDDDPVDGVHTAHSLRDLDRGEGAALHAPLFEEVIDWTDPITLEFDLEASQRGQNSTEKTTQEEREQTALGALYMSSAQIPDSPGEPTTIISDDEIDVDVKAMTVGSECDNFFWREADLPQPNAASVADLVGQLSGGFDSMNAPSSAGIQSFGFDPALLSQLPIAPEQVQELMQQAQALFNQHPSGPGVQAQFGGQDQNWNSNAATGDYGRGYADNGSARGRWASDRGQFRGRGRGRGRGEDGSYRSSKRKPCSFFAEGRCRYGDQCDFSHEPIYS
ncbi:uncharacterized protein F5147DRAFT_677688 [Suillus discolor]|uniref:Serine/threonine-protein phosphatase 1 regulatory subunit 10 n=1 Tax=Suillus discolor TaxID=1912936 RepID=A0A9P7FEK1_9AGAM|nr:uncharacterized protein F5147DRAFT_677688 [Suillus discolor]KAG2114708.1 hypothetical protein F5147DRAFT_677688 [Suillus discolor]